MIEAPIYARFLGTWRLEPASCDFEQGDAPKSGVCIIEEFERELCFTMKWTDAAGKSKEAALFGQPNSEAIPFDSGDLADALCVTASSPRELRNSAYFKGRELMVAQRQLDETGNAMRLTQVVRLSNGESPSNVSIYVRVH